MSDNQVARVLPTTGSDILFPEGMSLPDLQRVVVEHVRAAEGEVLLTHKFNVLPFEGAVALNTALQELFGQAWASNENAKITLTLEPGVDVTVPWGYFSVPGVEGDFETGVAHENGRLWFRLTASMRRKFEPEFHKVTAKVEEILKAGRLYKGRVFEVHFRDGDGDLIPFLRPVHMDVENAEMPIYARHVEKRIEGEVLSVIRNHKSMRRNNIPRKKGVLLNGTYGTGKTMLARFIARIAKKNGWTFVYVPQASEFADGYELAKEYAPAVLFVEDIDSVLGVIRDREVNKILNTIGGIQSKDDEVITIVTTNDIRKVHPAFLRPGRIDHIIDINALDADAAKRQVRALTKGVLAGDVDLDLIASSLAGQTGARIEHMVNTAKLYCINRTNGKGKIKLSLQDLVDATASTLGVQEEDLTQVHEPEVMMVDVRSLIASLATSSQNGNRHGKH